MRQVLIAVAVLSGASAAGAQQRVVTHGPAMPPLTTGMPHHHDWGGRTGGYWTAGLRAPGGYRAYRRPVRGYALPTYWTSPDFLIDDWSAYGLPRPFGKYHWSRYYDDAVLIDDRGSVYDIVEGVDWDRADDTGEVYADGAGAGYPPPPPGAGYPPPPPRGYARGAYPPPPYPPAPYPPALGYPAGPGGATTTVTTTSTGGYAGYGGTWVNGSYYGPGVTTITVQSTPVVTTTTTETIDDSVTYTRPVTRRVYVKRAWHPRGKLQCRCGR